MPNFNSKKRLKKKVLDRWENEGGMIPAAQTKVLESVSPDDLVGLGDEAQTTESPATDKGRTPKGAKSEIAPVERLAYD